ncbi:hypothetical protein NA57DRAFT_54955 [Rhizodiscina lignyota]|uniref:Uncharacterized protein n=1 Tax=Rhizodiscina lignyota TaxID=1504668 RepID=A0A9P4IJN1_9PEZI|nr:hypothetical protein NA57DRAFT_54955 [Rhizodiscina lignyota]
MASARAALAKSVVAKATHVRIYPPPADLGESREILKVLQRYGEVVTYKNLKLQDANTRLATQYEFNNPSPNSSLAIFRDQESVDRLISESPLRFALEPVEDDSKPPSRTPLTDLYNKLEAEDASKRPERTQRGWQVSESKDPFAQSLARETEDSMDPAAEPDSDTTSYTPSPAADNFYPESDPEEYSTEPQSSTKDSRGPRHFLLHAQPWVGIGFAHYLARTPYCGPFGIDTKSVAQQDLIDKVPLPGLSVVSLKQPSPFERIVAKQAMALKARRTLREIAEGRDEDGLAARGKMDDLSQFDVRGIMVSPKDGRSGHISIEESRRRARTAATDIGIDDWDTDVRGAGGGDEDGWGRAKNDTRVGADDGWGHEPRKYSLKPRR